MLRAAADGLNGGSHVFVSLHQIPARGKKLIAFDLATVINPAGRSALDIYQDFAPAMSPSPFPTWSA